MRVFSVLIFALAAVAVLVPTPVDARGALACGGKYSVAPGDSLSKIAMRAYGVNRSAELYAMNRNVIGSNHSILIVGTMLTIPCLDDLQATHTNAATGQLRPRVEPAAHSIVAAPNREQTGAVARENAFTSKTLVASPNSVVEIAFNKASAPDFILNTAIIDPLFEDIARVTQGRVRFVDAQISNSAPHDQMNLVLNGHADGAYIFNGFLAEEFPLLQITMTPMVGGTAQQTATALWRTHQRYFTEADQFRGLKLFGFVGAPPAHVWNVQDKRDAGNQQLVGNAALPASDIRSAGAKGKLRISAEEIRQIQSPVNAQPAPTKTIALNHAAAYDMGVWKSALSVTEVDGGIYAPTYSVFIRADKWAQISAKDREAIEALLGEPLAMRSAAWDSFDNAHKEAMLKRGLKIKKADLDLLISLQDSARLSWENWIAKADLVGVRGFEAIESFFAEMEKLRWQYPANGIQS